MRVIRLAVVFVLAVVWTASGLECTPPLPVAGQTSQSVLGEVVKPYGVVIGDFTGDGNGDIVFADAGSPFDLHFFKGFGNGTFEKSTVGGVTGDARQVLAAQMDGNLDLDVVLVLRLAGVRVLAGDGAGGFSTMVTLVNASFDLYTAAAVADVDGNGALDVLATSRSDGGALLLWKASSPGVFGGDSSAVFSGYTTLFGLVVAPVDAGDSDPDIVLCDKDTGNLWFSAGGTGGTFAPFTTLLTDAVGCTAVAVGDVNGDGLVDVVWGGSKGVEWLAAQGPTGGVFGASVPVDPVVTDVQDVQVVDYDSDGRLDVVLTLDVAYDVHWVPNVEGGWATAGGRDGVAQQLTENVARPKYVALGSLLGSGRPDLAIGSFDQNTAVWKANTGTGGSWGEAQLVQSLDNVKAAMAVDFNGDGLQDVLSVSDTEGVGIAWVANVEGLGVFAIRTEQPAESAADALGAVAVDLDLDGAIDVAWVAPDNSSVRWSRNVNGQGTQLAGPMELFPGIPSPSVVAMGDLDGDGDLDALVGSAAGGVRVYVSLHRAQLAGTGSIANEPAWTTGPVLLASQQDVYRVWLWDLDQDGLLDALVASKGDLVPAHARLAVLTNTWGGGEDAVSLSFAQNLTMDGSIRINRAESCLAHDFTEDGWPDIVCADALDSFYEIVMWPNLGTHPASFGGYQVLTTAAWGLRHQVQGVLAMEMDGNAGTDLVYVTSFGSNAEIGWLRNLGGGTFDPRPITLVTGLASGRDIQGVDLDGDGIRDLLLASSKSGTVEWLRRVEVDVPFPRPSTVITVDVGMCGYTVACIGEALSRASSCTADEVLLPSGRYVGCYQAHAYQLSKSVVLRPVNATRNDNVVIDCGAAGGGVLWEVRNSAQVTLRNLTITGGTTASLSPSSSTVLTVGDSVNTLSPARLTLESVALSDCEAQIAETVSQTEGGRGGGVLVTGGGELVATGCVFQDTHAAVAGGAVAISSQSSAWIRRSRFVGVHARVGGALYVGPQSTAVVEDTEFEGCEASSAGGVVYSSKGASVEMRRVHVEGNRAGVWGGVVAATAALPSAMESATGPSLLPQIAGTVAPSATTDGSGGAVTLEDLVVIDNHARYGALVYACEVPVTVVSLGASPASEGNTAEVGGGLAFVCTPATHAAAVVPSSSAAVPWVHVAGGSVAAEVASAVTAGVYGPHHASPVVHLGWVVAPREAVPSGTMLGNGTVVARDMFDQVISDDDKVLLRVSLSDPTGFALDGAVSGVRVLEDPVDLSEIQVLARHEDRIGGQVVLQVTVEDALTRPTLNTSITVAMCAPGQGWPHTTDAVVCEPCPELFFSSNSSIDRCRACAGVGEKAESLGVGATECLVCLVTQTLDSNATGTADARCVCKVNYYAPPIPSPGVPCLPCPTGAACDSPGKPPQALPGYYETTQPGEATRTFSRCRQSAACPGGQSTACGQPGGRCSPCSAQYTGFMCKECASDYYFAADGTCKACPDAAVGALVGFFMLLLLLTACVLGLLVYAQTQYTEDEAVAMEKLRRRKIPHSFSIAIIFLQILALLGNAQLGWPTAVQRAMTAASALNLRLSVFASECSLNSYVAMYVLSVLYPLLFIGFVVVALVIIKGLRHAVSFCADMPELEFRTTLERVVFLVGPLLYIPLVQTAIEGLDCRRLRNNKWYLDANPAIECYQGEWWVLLPFSLLAIVLYVTGLPVYFAQTMWSHREQLFEPLTLLRFGSIYRLYRRRFFFFELVQLGRRFVIVVCFVLFSDNQTWLVAILMCLFVGSAIVQEMKQPYYNPIYNTLEVRLQIALSVLLMAGFAYFADVFQTQQSRTTFIVFTMSLLFLTLVFLGVAAAEEMGHVLPCFRKGTQDENIRLRRFWKIVESEAPDWPDQRLLLHIQEARQQRIAGIGGTSGSAPKSGRTLSTCQDEALVGDVNGIQLEVVVP